MTLPLGVTAEQNAAQSAINPAPLFEEIATAVGQARGSPSTAQGLARPRTVAAASSASIRPRTRLAVSGFSDQIGSRTCTTRPVSSAETSNSPQTGVHRGGEGVFPLLAVSRIAPARPVLFDELDGALAERLALSGSKALPLPLSHLGR